jgi:hypothetical protein
MIAVMSLVSLPAAAGQGETDGAIIGAVRLQRPVLADGKPLPAGTYQVRLGASASPVAGGQSPGAERWVEFVRGGTAVGREVATVIPAGDIKAIAKGRQPGAGRTQVDVLKNDEFVRIWMRHGDQHYIIHLPPGSGS